MLKGEKVTLRAIEKDDAELLRDWANDFELHKLADDDVFVLRNLEQTEKFFEELGKSDEEIGPFMIEADGTPIGTCGLHHVDRRSRTISFGINISNQDYLGQGYGRDAVTVLIDYSFRHLNMRKMWLTVYADNERAIRAYKGLGFAEEGLLKEHVFMEGVYKDWLYMGLFRRDWDPKLGD